MSAPVALVSVREFARLDGCDDKLVRRAIQAGKLAVSADGKLDPALAGTGWRRQNRRATPGADSGADTAQLSAPNVRTGTKRNVRTAKRAGKGAPPSADELDGALEDLAAEAADDFLAKVLAGDFRDIGTAERIKENALAAKHLIAARKEAGNLVEVDRAEGIFFEAARAWRDAWMGFPTRIGPLLAADLDVDTDKVVEALTVHVHQTLEQLGEPTAEFAAPE
jgi:hypothetical protein